MARVNDDSAIPSAAPRRAGRRPRKPDGSPELSRAAVIDCAVRLAQRESIAELSMMRLARELGITPGLVHYYVGSRDELISAIINIAYRERVEALPQPSGDWRRDLEAVALISSRMMLRWKGVASYVATHNRNRLFQTLAAGETDWGLAFFDRVGRILQQGGFSAEQAAMAYHLLMLFLVGVGSADAHRQTPAQHRDFIRGYVGRPEADGHDGARFLVGPFTQIDTETTLRAGLALLLDGFAGWLRGEGAVSAAAGAPARTATRSTRARAPDAAARRRR
ncbi:MAG: TetR/AcrR family transcriptional regulator [Burkholderiaceae bacterium]